MLINPKRFAATISCEGSALPRDHDSASGGVDGLTLTEIMGSSLMNIEDLYGQILVRDVEDELTRRRDW